MKTRALLSFLALATSAFAAPADFNAVTGYGTPINPLIISGDSALAKASRVLTGPFFDAATSELAMENIALASETAEPNSRVRLRFTLTFRNTGSGYYEGIGIEWESPTSGWNGVGVTTILPEGDLEPNATRTLTVPVEVIVPNADRDAAVADILAGKRLRPTATELFRFTLPVAAIDQATETAFSTIAAAPNPGERYLYFSSSTPLLTALQANSLLVEAPAFNPLTRPSSLASLIHAQEISGVDDFGQGRETVIGEVLENIPDGDGRRLRVRTHSLRDVLAHGSFLQVPADGYDGATVDPYRPEFGTNAFSQYFDFPDVSGLGLRHPLRLPTDAFRAMHFPINDVQIASGIKVDGQILLDALNVEVKVRVRDGDIKHVSMKLGTKAEMTLRLTADLNANNTNGPLASREKQLFTVPLPPLVFNILGVPITIQPNFIGKVGAELRAPTNAVIPVSASMECGVVMGWDDRRPQNDKYFYTPFSKLRPLEVSDPLLNDSLAFTASAFAEAGLQVQVDGIAGPYFGARATAEFVLDPTNNPWWSLDAYVDTVAKFDVDLFGLPLSDPQGILRRGEALFNKARPETVPRGSGLPGGVSPGSFDPVSGGDTRWIRKVEWEQTGPNELRLARLGTTEDVIAITQSFATKQPIMRIGAKGNVVWAKGAQIVVPVDITPVGANGFYMVGDYLGSGFYAFYDGDGVMQFSQQFKLTDAGNNGILYYISNIVSTTSGTYIAGTVYPGGQFEQYPFVIKYDTAGNVAWCKKFTATNMNGDVKQAIALADGNLLLCGEAKGSRDPMQPITAGSEYGGMLMKISPSGSVLWTNRSLGAISYRSCTVGPDGAIYVGGYFQPAGVLDFPSFVVAKHKPNGDMERIVTIGENMAGANPVVPGVVRDHLPAAGLTPYDTAARVRWTPIGLVVGGNTERNGVSARAPLMMAFSEQLSLRWWTTHDGTSNEDGLFDFVATGQGLFTAGYTKSIGLSGSGSAVALFNKLPWDGKVKLGPQLSGISKYLLPSVMQLPSPSALQIGIPSPDQGYHGTFALTFTPADQPCRTDGTAPPQLTDTTSTVTYSGPLQADPRDFVPRISPGVDTYLPEVMRTSTTLKGFASSGLNRGYTARFEWGLAADALTNLTPAVPVPSNVAFRDLAADIATTPGTTYFFRARLDHSSGPLFGPVREFTFTNHAPVARQDNQLYARPTGSTVLPVLNNDSDADNDDLTITATEQQASGTLTIAPGGKSLIYTPDADHPGTDSFYYTITDGDLTSQAYVSITTTSFRVPFSDVTVLSSSGTPLPDTTLANASITGFGTPAISQHRLLTSTITTRIERKIGSGILKDFGHPYPELLALSDRLVPGLPGVRFSSFGDPAVGASGSVAFSAKLKGRGITPLNDDSLWSTAGGGLSRIVAEGGTLPALGTARISQIMSFSIRDGDLIALLKLRSGGGVNASNDTALVRIEPGGESTLLARKGSAIGGGDTTIVQGISALSPALGSPGHGRTHADGGYLTKLRTSLRGEKIVSFAPDGTPDVLLSTGNNAPAIAAGAKWAKFGLPAFDPGSASYALHTTLSTGLGGVTALTDTALIFRQFGNPLIVIAREGDPAPGTTANFGSFLDPVVNADLKVAFHATLRGSGVTRGNASGVWFGDPAAPALVARTGDEATDFDGQPIAGVRWSSFTNHALPGCEGGGPVFLATLSGTGVTLGNKTGLWARDSEGTLRQYLRTGDVLYSGGQNRTVSSIAILTAGNGPFGATRSFNSIGTLAARVTFTDRTQALVRMDVP